MIVNFYNGFATVRDDPAKKFFDVVRIMREEARITPSDFVVMKVAQLYVHSHTPLT
jgi:hypothetical protein